MADLGTINYTNVNAGTSREDRSAEVAGIGAALGVAKKGINEGIKAKVTGDMLDAVAEAEQKSGLSPVMPQEMPFDPTTYPTGSREAYIKNRLDRLQAVAEQGKQSQRTLAEIQIKSILAEAQAKYPWLYDELQGRAGSIMAGSAQLQEIGVEDDARTASARDAQSKIDDILKDAYEEWDKGGKGIPTGLSPSDPYFQRLWAERSRMRQEFEAQAVGAGMALANARGDLNQPGYVSTLNKFLAGRYSLVNIDIQNTLISHGWDKFMAERAKGSRGDARFIEDFKIDRVNSMIREMGEKKAAFVNLWTNDGPNPDIQLDKRGELIWKRYEEVVAFYDQQIQWLQDYQNDVPNAEQFLNRAYMIEANDIFVDLPEKHGRLINYFTNGHGAKLMELGVEVGNPEMVKIANRMGLISQQAIGESFPELVDGTHADFVSYLEATYAGSTERLALDANADAAEIVRAIDQRLMDDSQSFVVPSSNEDERQVLALHNFAVHDELWNKAVEVNKDADPAFASNTLLGATYSLRYLNTSKEQPGNLHREVWSRLANGSLDQAIDRALDDPNMGRRMAFGSSLNNWYAHRDPIVERRKQGEYYRNHKVHGVALSELVWIDVNAIDKGEFKMVVKPEAAKRAAQQYLATRMGSQTRAPTQKEIRDAERKVEEDALAAMIPVRNTMMDQIKIERMINKATAVSKDSMKLADDWTTFFLGEGDSIPLEDTWAGQFNFTEGFASRGKGTPNLGGAGEE